jgi:hypothetical protein
VKSRTLHDIYEDLVKKRHYMGITCFRVRDTDTLLDYVICRSEHWEWDYQNMPKRMWALLLEPGYNCFYPMDATEKIYTLLSTQKELDYLKTLGSKFAVDVVKMAYQGY